MKTKKIIAMLLLGTALLSAGKNTAPAETPVAPVALPWPLYIGLGVVMTDIDRDPCPCANGETIAEDHRYGGVLRIGMDFNEYLGVEARVLKSLESGVFSETTHYGLYFKPQFSLSEDLKIYGLLGYGTTEIDYTNGIRDSSTDESGVAYGAGVEYRLSRDEDGNGWSLWADYSRVLKDKGAVHSTVDVFAAGGMCHF